MIQLITRPYLGCVSYAPRSSWLTPTKSNDEVAGQRLAQERATTSGCKPYSTSSSQKKLTTPHFISGYTSRVVKPLGVNFAKSRRPLLITGLTSRVNTYKTWKTGGSFVQSVTTPTTTLAERLGKLGKEDMKMASNPSIPF